MSTSMAKRSHLILLPLLLVAACGGGGSGGGGSTAGGGSNGSMGQTESASTKNAQAVSSPTFQTVTDSMMRADAAGMDWLMYGGTYNNQRHSSLDQVTTSNVGQLAPAWIFQTGINKSFENTPVVVDGVMYITTPEKNQVIALNAATGEQLWKYEPNIATTHLCCGPNNRGVAVYGDNVYEATLDARLIALDKATGKKVWEAQVANPADGYSITAAPLAFDGKVVTGIAGGEYGIRGRITAYDAKTGTKVWTFYTIPAPKDAPNGWWGEWKEKTPFGLDLHRDIAKEKADSAKYADAWQHGGGASWMTPAYDPDTHTLYISVGNPSPDLDGSVRPGDNLYTQSIVALNADSGTYKWHFQYIPHGVWDLDATSPPTIFTLNGRKVVGHAGKIGFYYILDAETGKPILRSQNFVPMDSLFTPPTKQGVHMLPGANGGSEWSPTAYSPETNMVYILGLNQPMTYTTEASRRPAAGQIWLGSAFTGIPGKSQWGTFTAIDVNTGDVKWSRKVTIPMQGGALSTAGGLVFVGEGSGAFDAFDAKTGELLWQFPTGAGVNAAPVTYSVNGVQYVAVAAGGIFQIDTQRGDNVIAFALPSQRQGMITGTYSQPTFHRTPSLRYQDVENGSANPPSEIVTGDLNQNGQQQSGQQQSGQQQSGQQQSGQQQSGQQQTSQQKSGLQQYMTQDVNAKTVTYDLKAALDATNHGWNFDGYANGNLRLEVPQGWKVTINFTNLDPSLPHSVGVTKGSANNLPASGDAATPAFSGSVMNQFSNGIGPNKSTQFSFTANQSGQYLLMCGVPGHAQGGMWDRFDVSASADSASISATRGM